MNEQKAPRTDPDDLTNATEPESIELAEEDLDRVSGGATNKIKGGGI